MPRSTQKPTTPPTITPHRAVELLTRQIERADQVVNFEYDDPKVDAWESMTENILTQAFGLPNGERHPNTEEFKYAHRGSHHINMSRDEMQSNHVLTQQLRVQLLSGYVEQLQELAPPAATTAPDQYRFHPDIERHSGHLLRDGHYKQAALEAYICVIEAVKAKSGLPLDGDPLMNQAFGCDGRVPIIQVNDLRTGADRDEQRGFLHLFKGVVGLRNLKAHSNRLFNDPARAHEYLALSSLLLRILEMSSVNPQGAQRV